LTQAYAADLHARLGVKLLKNHQIPVKSPDASPFGFFGFGYLKQRLFRRRARTEAGVWKLMKEEWSKIDLDLLTQVFSAWKRRLRLVCKASGRHRKYECHPYAPLLGEFNYFSSILHERETICTNLIKKLRIE
jgi:hypothetical protein